MEARSADSPDPGNINVNLHALVLQMSFILSAGARQAEYFGGRAVVAFKFNTLICTDLYRGDLCFGLGIEVIRLAGIEKCHFLYVVCAQLDYNARQLLRAHIGGPYPVLDPYVGGIPDSVDFKRVRWLGDLLAREIASECNCCSYANNKRPVHARCYGAQLIKLQYIFAYSAALDIA